MAIPWRKATLFGGALVAGVAAGAIGMMSLRGGDGPYASSPAPATRTMGSAPASTAFLSAVAGNCELAPMLPAASEGDGQEALQAKAAGLSADAVGSLILSGKEAAASGRQRDAEVAFLNACRNAAVLKEGDGAPLADAMYQLGRHYANAAAFGAPGSGDLLQRAERLYSASLEAYRAHFGEDHEKTRFAREGLTTVQHATGGRAPTAIAQAPAAPAVAPAPATALTEPAAPDPVKAPDPVHSAAPAATAALVPVPAPRVAKAPAPPKPVDAPALEQAAADRKPVQPRRSSAPAATEAKAPVAEEPSPPVQPRRAASRSATAQAEPEAPAPNARPRPLRMEPPPDSEPPAFDPAPSRTNALGAGAETPTAEGSAGTP
jgi:hypothetical protein